MRYIQYNLLVAASVLVLASPAQGKVSDSAIARIRETVDAKSRTLLVLEQLPASLDEKDQFNWLVSQLDLKALDKTHVGLMVASELRLEKAFRSTPGTFEMTNGGKMQISLLSGIVRRIEVLLLNDIWAFRKSRERTTSGPMGFTDHFQALAAWCKERNIEPEAAALIPVAINETVNKALPKPTSAALKVPDVPTQAPSYESTSSTPWIVVTALVVAAIGLLWLLLKNRK